MEAEQIKKNKLVNKYLDIIDLCMEHLYIHIEISNKEMRSDFIDTLNSLEKLRKHFGEQTCNQNK